MNRPDPRELYVLNSYSGHGDNQRESNGGRNVGIIEKIFAGVTEHSRIAIVAMLLLTVVVGSGASAVEQSSSLDQFQSDTVEAEKLDYVESNFATGGGNTTAVQVIVRDDNVLDKASLSEMLALQAELRANGTINGTLADDNAMVGIPNLVATVGIQQEIGRELGQTSAEFQQLNATVSRQQAAIQETRTELERREAALNETSASLRDALTTLRTNPALSAREQFEEVQSAVPVSLEEADFATFNRSVQLLRTAESDEEIQQAYRMGTQGILAEEYEQLQNRSEGLESTAAELEENGDRLQALGAELQRLQADLENASSASLATQREQLASMNQSEIDGVLTQVLGDGASRQAFAFMPTHYEPGSTTTNATMLLITQQTDSAVQAGAASDRLVDSQLAIQSLAGTSLTENDDAIVFGVGMISEEITQSMADSLAIVGPLALLFVVLALAIAYRDVLDILLGLVGIALVLAMTFGVMGWAGIAFNQMFVAVPVLLIGLSIDYAIHTFMRHREERHNDNTDSSVRGGMRVALSGVGVALVWVTATTVIGFLSNVTSPVPPIQEFGLVSAAGIVAALLVFAILVPALKIELDELLERFGFDRKKRAFGTGGGRLSAALGVGSTLARKAPYVVIGLALLISAAGAFGGSQVDTSFNQEDFIAEDPPGWTKDLPEPFKPGDYSAKENLAYVNDNFLRQDSSGQILVEGGVATPEAMADMKAAQDAAADKESVQVLSSGNADIQSPLSVIRTVAASNETFNATLQAADTDGDGVPDQNIGAVYDALFATAPDQAAGVIYRSEAGDYEAMRLVISVQGSASGDAVTADLRDVAERFDTAGLTATATGQNILFKIIQDQLLDTVIESLLITLVAVFAFLMITYRVTEGSAILGAVTLLPVVLSVSWILGTMYLLGIPFNIMTGMITSLTIGLGVAYSIHLSERYNQELERAETMWDAMHTAVTGTGGALLGSAATTVGGFGVLAFAILPPLQQFGIITGLTITYAFIASVLVLPSMLVVWTRYFGPARADVGSQPTHDVATPED
jgi:predicted RND superfamily exporter protein